MQPLDGVVTVAVALFQAIDPTHFNKGIYSPVWVDRLYRGIRRNYSGEFRMVCYTDNMYTFKERVEVFGLRDRHWQYALKQLYETKAPGRLVTLGLDTVITGNLDELFGYNGRLAVPRDPYNPTDPCNCVVLMDGARPDLAVKPGKNDMTTLADEDYDWIDDVFPGQVESYKVQVVPNGSVKRDQRIVYFHGDPKPHQVEIPWIKDAWV